MWLGAREVKKVRLLTVGVSLNIMSAPGYFRIDFRPGLQR